MKAAATMILLVIMCVTVCYAENSDQPPFADYIIPNDVAVQDEAVFYGVWEAKYVVIQSRTYHAKAMNVNYTLELFADAGMLYMSNRPFYLGSRELKDGHLVFTDSSGTIELILCDDGNVHIIQGGLPVYYEKQTVSYDEITYRSLARRPEDYDGTFAVIHGEIIQVMGTRTGEFYQFRLAVDGDYDHIVFCEFIHRPDYNILVGDQVAAYVHLAGEYTYETIRGDSLTVPLAFVHDIEVND